MFDFPCFVISMKRSRERRERIISQFRHLGIPFEFVDAIDGGAMRAAEISKSLRSIYSYSLGFKILPGEVGCALSHRKALQIIAEGSHDVALVFEDDAVLASDFCSRVSKALINLPDLGMLKLSGGWGPRPHFGRIAARFGDSRIVELTSPTPLLTGYAVSKRAAQKLVRFLFPLVDIIDLDIARVWAHKVVIQELLPYPVQPSGVRSTVDPDLLRIHLRPDEKSFVRTLRRLPFRLERNIGLRIFLARRFGWQAVRSQGLELITT